jgi:hypothetical protein
MSPANNGAREMSSTATRPESLSRHAGFVVDGILSRNPDGHGDAANEPCSRTSQTKRAPLVPGAENGSCSTAAQTTVGSAPAGGACRWAAAMAASRERAPGGAVGPVVAQAQPETAGVGVAGGDATAHPATLSRASRTTANLITLAGRSMMRTGSVASTVVLAHPCAPCCRAAPVRSVPSQSADVGHRASM